MPHSADDSCQSWWPRWTPFAFLQSAEHKTGCGLDVKLHYGCGVFNKTYQWERVGEAASGWKLNFAILPGLQPAALSVDRLGGRVRSSSHSGCVTLVVGGGVECGSCINADDSYEYSSVCCESKQRSPIAHTAHVEETDEPRKGAYFWPEQVS